MMIDSRLYLYSACSFTLVPAFVSSMLRFPAVFLLHFLSLLSLDVHPQLPRTLLDCETALGEMNCPHPFSTLSSHRFPPPGLHGMNCGWRVEWIVTMIAVMKRLTRLTHSLVLHGDDGLWFDRAPLILVLFLPLFTRCTLPTVLSQQTIPTSERSAHTTHTTTDQLSRAG
jgi:hypothetical protein